MNLVAATLALLRASWECGCPSWMHAILLLILKNHTVKTEQAEALLSVPCRGCHPCSLIFSCYPPSSGSFVPTSPVLTNLGYPQSLEQGLPWGRDSINIRKHFRLHWQELYTSKRQSHLPGMFSFTAFWERQKYMNVFAPKRSLATSSKEYA